MKQFLVPVLALAALAAQAQSAIPAERLSELRQAIQQSRINPAAAGGTRQLTADERAELRRQVQEQSRGRAKP